MSQANVVAALSPSGGVIFVVCVTLFRAGIVGVLGQWLKRPL
jgi:hypothetical protein